MKMNNKLIKILIITLTIVGISSVYAAVMLNSSDIFFDNSKSGIKSDNVQGAIDELYELTYGCSSSNVSKPVIKEGLIPVVIEDDGTVKVVNENDSNWYNYCNKIWANAVILDTDESYNVGDVIPESAIRAYFVWIPKYKYQLWNIGVSDTTILAHSINIVFDTENTTDKEGECATPMTSGSSGNCQNGDYMTHPAFISMGVNGFWVGKYELTGSIDNLTVKPNQVSLRNQTVSSFFSAMYNFNRKLDSHMMKNTEWGAVAYLSHSKYGIDGEININNNSSYKTGYSALLTTQQGTYPGTSGDGISYNKTYNTDIGYLASTTGNISGIYDMSGGAHEYMASYRSGASIPTGEAKYFDVYNGNSSEATYNYRILGDATGEMGPFVDYKDGDGNTRHHNQWYADASYFVFSTNPWFTRGGICAHGVLAGQFIFHGTTNAVLEHVSSRLVLAPQ